MNADGASEARLEVALAQAIINEVKYGTETGQLAELSLLASFTQRSVGGKLAHALHLLLPGVKYLSIGALLKDGVVVRTSDLAVKGPVSIQPQTLRGSAARVAARKHHTFHTKLRQGDTSNVKYYELQEAWQQSSATSILSIPIPAVRAYESASIVDTQEETVPDPTVQPSPGLHNMNGAIGIVTLGLDAELDNKQARAFQGLAQSLSPFLAYYAAPVLAQLQDQIQEVATANAVYVARMKGRQHATSEAKQHDRPAEPPQRVLFGAISPFSSAPPKRSSSEDEDVKVKASSPATSREASNASNASSSATAKMLSNHSVGHGAPVNPFAQAASQASAKSETPDTGSSQSSGLHSARGSETRQQPVSPFAAAAQASGRLFSQQVSADGQALSIPPSVIDIPGGLQQPDVDQSQKHSTDSNAGPHARLLSGPGSQGSSSHGRPSGSSNEKSEFHEVSSHEQLAETLQQEAGSEDEATPLDAPYVFKRRPLLASHTRRYSTSTFFQGVLHTPSAHFSFGQKMPGLTEEKSDDVEQQTPQQLEPQIFVVDDYTYAAASQNIQRRALSTPQDCVAECPLDESEVSSQMLAHASCPGPFLLEEHYQSSPGLLNAETQESAAQTHLMLHGQLHQAGNHQGVLFGSRTSIEYSRVNMPALSGTASSPAKPSRFSAVLGLSMPTDSASRQAPTQTPKPAQHLSETPLAHTASPFGQHNLHHSTEASSKGSVQQEADAPSRDSAQEDPAVLSKPLQQAAGQQHPFWMTFSEPKLEQKFTIWFGRKCSKVDTIFMLALTIYITQLLFFTWALQDQQTHKWPLVGYAMLPVIMLQHGDATWYLKHRCIILSIVRLLLLAFLAFVVPHVAQHRSRTCHNWFHIGSIGPVVVVPLGLMVRFKHHAVLHAIACASLVIQGMQACIADSAASVSWHTASMQRLAVATCTPSLLLYLVEMRARAIYLQQATS